MSLQGVPLSTRRRRVPTPTETTVTLASALLTVTPDVRPAVANALWTRLVRAEHDPREVWKVSTRPAAHWQSGLGRPIVTTTPPIPSPDSYAEVTEEALYAYAPASETRLHLGLSVKLHREAHDAVLRALTVTERWQYKRALREGTCSRPFLREPSRPSGWRRNHRDELVTEAVVMVLEQLAVAAIVEVVNPEVERAALRDA